MQNDFEASVFEVKHLLIQSQRETNKSCKLAGELCQSYTHIPQYLRYVLDYSVEENELLVESLHGIKDALVKEEGEVLQVNLKLQLDEYVLFKA